MVANAELLAMPIGPDQYPLDITSLRALIGGLRPGSGPLDPADFRLTPSAPEAGLSVDIGPGRALLEGPNTGQGSYFAHSSAPKLFPWPIGPSAQTRYDTLVLVVRDSQYGAISGPLGPDWIVIEGTPGAAAVPVSDAEITSQLQPGDLWLAAHDVRVQAGAQTFTAADLARRFQPLTTARTGSELKVSTASNPAFHTWVATNPGNWKDFPSQYWDPVTVYVPDSGQLRCTITGRAGIGPRLPSVGTVRMRYRMSGANEVSGETLTQWSFVARGSIGSYDSSSCSKTLRGLNPGWTTLTPQFFISSGTPQSEVGVSGGDLDVQPVV